MKQGLIFLILTVLSFSIYASDTPLFQQLNTPGPKVVSLVNDNCYDDCYSECASECDGDECCEQECDECCTECCEPCEPPPVVEVPCTLVPPRVGRPPQPGYEPNPPHYDVTWVCETDQDVFTRPLFKKIEKDLPEVYTFGKPEIDFGEPREVPSIMTLMLMPRMEMINPQNPLPLCYTSFIGRCQANNLKEKLSNAGLSPFGYY